MKLLLDRIKLSLLKRTGIAQKKKNYEWWKAKGYDNQPEVTFIFQTHNKSLEVCHVLEKLRRYEGSKEIIVIDDGSSPEHTRRLAKALTGPNDFLLRSNDLFEVVTYDRAVRMANGKYIALMQDDDDFAGTSWVNRAVELFKKYPRMAILGGKQGSDVELRDGALHRVKTEAEGPFSFVCCVCRAPMWINKELFDQYLHHNDFLFAPVQYDDDEICLRSWTLGLQVGRYDARFRSLSAGGMRLWNRTLLSEQTVRNGKRLCELYRDQMTTIQQKVDESNKAL